jgi:hypothetical protein
MPKMSMKKTLKVLQKAVPKDLPKMSFKKTLKVLHKAVPKAMPKAVPNTTKKRKLPRFFKMKLWKRTTPKKQARTPVMAKMRNSPMELSLQTIYSKSEAIPVAEIHRSKSHTREEYMKNQHKKSLKHNKKQNKKSLQSVRLIV